MAFNIQHRPLYENVVYVIHQSGDNLPSLVLDTGRMLAAPFHISVAQYQLTNLSKFFNAVSLSLHGANFNWIALIERLNIRDLFVEHSSLDGLFDLNKDIIVRLNIQNPRPIQ